jgi:hypothetical protein
MTLKKTSKTDIGALKAMSDEDIDYSDIPKLSEEFMAAANWIIEVPAKELRNNWKMRIAPQSRFEVRPLSTDEGAGQLALLIWGDDNAGNNRCYAERDTNNGDRQRLHGKA